MRSSCACTRTWVSSHCVLTAELSWSESMKPSDRENRGIKHYHQKQLQCSLLRPHSFLQSSCSFVCSFVVSVRMVRLFESMHFSDSITWWEKRWAEGKKKKSWDNNRKVRTPSFFIFINQYSDHWFLISDSHLHLSLCLRNSSSQNHIKKFYIYLLLSYYVTLQGKEVSRHAFLPLNSAMVCCCRNWHTWCQCGS